MENKAKLNEFRVKHEAFIYVCDEVEGKSEWNKDELGEMDVFYSSDLATIAIRLIAVDGNITSKEVSYLNMTFGFKYTKAELEELYRNAKDDIGNSFDESFENGITYLRKISDDLADRYKELLSLICQIIIESDGVVTAIEKSEVEKLIKLCK